MLEYQLQIYADYMRSNPEFSLLKGMTYLSKILLFILENDLNDFILNIYMIFEIINNCLSFIFVCIHMLKKKLRPPLNKILGPPLNIYV